MTIGRPSRQIRYPLEARLPAAKGPPEPSTCSISGSALHRVWAPATEASPAPDRMATITGRRLMLPNVARTRPGPFLRPPTLLSRRAIGRRLLDDLVDLFRGEQNRGREPDHAACADGESKGRHGHVVGQ